MSYIAIIDYGMGNLGSILNMLNYLNIRSKITSKLVEIEKAEKIILPGVGAFDNGIGRIEKLNMKSILDNKAYENETPILGICLGMQLLTNNSEEGNSCGLGWIEAKTIKFSNENGLKIPHMGWNNVEVRDSNNPLIKNMDANARFYFVHSYYVKCSSENNSVCTTNHGINFDSIICRNNIFGCQFHPEKSHKYGMTILKNFSDL